MAKPDRYLRMLAGIPRLENRLRCIMFKLRFDDEIETAMAELRRLDETASAVMLAQPLHALLQAVLHVGNEVNAGTHKGGIRGFRLSSLMRFVEHRSTVDPKTTLLHYVVEVLMDNGAEALLDVRPQLWTPNALVPHGLCAPALLARS